ncbi:MAG: tyrosine-type recombinase/integrase [Succiniclasticum sp.]|nr:tyrosine-type recombinase/integrase [Succiniclasticum sp.]
MASIRKRGETFTITAYMGYDDSGKQRKKTTTYRPPDGVTAGKAEKLAKQYAAVWEEKIRGYVALDENRTFRELADWYYSSVAPNRLKPHTLIHYKEGIDKHIMPTLGHEKLKNITPPMLDRLFTELQRSGNSMHSYRLKDKELCGGMTRQALADKAGIERSTLYTVLRGQTVGRGTAEKIAAALDMKLDKAFDDVTENTGLTGASANKLKLNLSAIFTAAVKKEIMRRNPCKLATPPKVDTRPAEYLDEEQARKLLALVHDSGDFQFEVIVNLLLATGMRAGELSALYWEDIDLDTGLLYIRHTLIRLNGEYIRETTKTDDSTRRIMLPDYITDLLSQHKRRQRERRFRMGAAWVNPELVFTNQHGNFYITGNMNSKLKRVIKGSDLPQDLHLHSLRHTFASLLINGNVSARIIADRLGHSTTKTTLDTYSHVYKESEARAMQAVDIALFKDRGKAPGQNSEQA